MNTSTPARELRGGPLAKSIKEAVRAGAAALRERGVVPKMAAVIATKDPSAWSYLQSKQKVAATLGIEMEVVDLGETATQASLHETLQRLSSAPDVHGIILELPLAPGLDSKAALPHIAQAKDVDGLTPANIGLIAMGREAEAILPATPQACIELAELEGPLRGKEVAVIGRGQTVGRPLISMLINRDATVTVCHTRTPDLARAIRHCDVVFVAAGKAGLLRGEHLGEGQTVIDAGINVVGESIVGDADAGSVSAKAAAFTPVPGGVGPLTSAIIFRNLLAAVRLSRPDAFDPETKTT